MGTNDKYKIGYTEKNLKVHKDVFLFYIHFSLYLYLYILCFVVISVTLNKFFEYM